jgi:hypothetical protein
MLKTKKHMPSRRILTDFKHRSTVRRKRKSRNKRNAKDNYESAALDRSHYLRIAGKIRWTLGTSEEGCGFVGGREGTF